MPKADCWAMDADGSLQGAQELHPPVGDVRRMLNSAGRQKNSDYRVMDSKY
jgi:hypothetical protein